MKRILLSLAIVGSILFTSCGENKPKNTIPTEVASMVEKGVVDTTLTVVTENYTYTFKNDDKKELISKTSNAENTDAIFFVGVLVGAVICSFIFMAFK